MLMCVAKVADGDGQTGGSEMKPVPDATAETEAPAAPRLQVPQVLSLEVYIIVELEIDFQTQAAKKRSSGGVMMQAYRAFTSQALLAGYSMAGAAEMWKHSTVRRIDYCAILRC